MYRKFLASFSAVAMAAVLMSTQAVTVFATEGDPITTTVEDSGTVAGVAVTGDNAVGVNASTGDNINVTNDVVVSGENSVGVQADAGKVIVNGDIKATGEGSVGINASGSSTVYVKHDVDGASKDVVTDGNGTIVVGASDTLPTVDIAINPDDDDAKGRVAVYGTVSSENGAAIQVDASNETYSSVEDIVNDIPDIIVYKLAGEAVSSIATVNGEDVSEQLNQAIKESINYIVESHVGTVIFNGDYSHQQSFTGVGSVATTRLNEKFYVDLSLQDGEILYAGPNVSVSYNADRHMYELELFDPAGGINIVRYFRVNPTSFDENGDVETYEIIVPDNTQSIVTDASADSTIINTGNFAIVETKGVADAPAAIAAISGDKPARTISLTMSTMTAAQYQEAVVNHVGNTPVNGAFNIETDTISCFDSRMIEAIASRPDIDVNVVFTYQGKKMKVTIPAGYDVKTLLDANGYCGFLRLMAILGGTQI